MTIQSTATGAIEYVDGTIDLCRDGEIIDTITPAPGESRSALLARVGLVQSDGQETWANTEAGSAVEFDVEQEG